MRKAALLILILLITGCAGSLPTPQQLATEDFGQCPPDYRERIQNGISQNLIDPYSAVYRFSAPEKYRSAGKFSHRIVVGVNAKNRCKSKTICASRMALSKKSINSQQAC